MGKAKELTEEERGKIDLLRQLHPDWTNKAIADAIERRPETVGRYLKFPETYGLRERSGRQDRAIASAATNRKLSLAEIKTDLNLTCGRTTIWKRLTGNETIAFGRHQSKPVLTKRHKVTRLSFAREMVSTSPEK